ncbi:MAG: hypothetical protein H8E66_35440 [Planctomycetes bacterium]|nr:hypothetical protein [Planctomycetota bacterium]
MDAPVASHQIDSLDDPVPRIARQTVAFTIALTLLLAVVAAIRGLLGVFEAPHSAFVLIAAGVAVEVLASGIRVAWSRLYLDATRFTSLLARLVIPSICVICLAIAMSLAGANSWSVGFVWLVITGGELAWWYPKLSAVRDRNLEQPETAAAVTDIDVEEANQSETCVDEEEETELDTNVIQQTTRARNDDGVEIISGVLRAEFAAGERAHNLHVAFCPPLAYEPEVIAHQLDGPPITLKVAQSEIFGTRIELRLTKAAMRSENAAIYFEVQPRQARSSHDAVTG